LRAEVLIVEWMAVGVLDEMLDVIEWMDALIDVPSIVLRAHNLLDCETFARVEARGNKLMSTKLLSTDSSGL
jgi:hypothetical protein